MTTESLQWWRWNNGLW